MSKGKAFERYLDAYHEQLSHQCHAYVAKVPTPVQITGRTGRGVSGRLEPRVWVDYTGLLWTGIAVAIEAKQCAHRDRFQLSNVQPHQMECLQRVASLGGVAILVVRKTSLPTADYAFHVSADGIDTGGPKSIRWDSPLAERSKIPRGGGWCDTL